MNATNISAAKPKELTQELSSLTPGNVFRLPDTVFEEVMGGDEPGGHFYYVGDQKKDGMVVVISVDWKSSRKLPEETKVILHQVNIEIVPNRLA